MTRKKNFTPLILVLVALCALAFLLANPFKKTATDETGAVSGGEKEGSGKLLVDVKKDDVTAFSVTPAGKAQDAFTLQKDGDKWYAVQGAKKYHADQDRVDKLLDQVPGLRSESLATDKADKYGAMGVDDTTGVKLGVFTSKGDKPAAELIVGNAAPGYSSTFVRVGGGKEVWRSTQNIKSLVGFTYKDYRTKQPWKFDPQLATSITVRPVAGQPETYKNDKGVWKTASGANANQNALTKLLHDWTEANVSDYADEVTPGVTPFIAAPETASTSPITKPAKEPAASPPPLGQYKVGKEPNLVAETPQGKYSFTLGEKENALYYVADQEGLVYKSGEPQISFFRELKFADLKIAPPDAKPGNDPAVTIKKVAPLPDADKPAQPATPPAKSGK